MDRKKIVVLDKTCEECGKTFQAIDSKRQRKKRFCNGSCAKSNSGKRNKGRKFSEEVNKSKGRSGELNGFYSRKHSQEIKDCIGFKNSKSYEEKYGIEKAERLKKEHSERMMGEGNPFYKKTHTDEVRLKLGRDMKKEKNPMFGRGDLLKGDKNGSWNGGISFGEYGLEFNDELRTKIRTRDSFVCAICDKNGFDIHHIDYDKKNNSKKNLITLCRSCHAKTNFKRKEWQTLFENIINKKYE
jgi:hypothetical protein